MALFNKLKTLDSKFSWSFFGFLLGIVGIGYAIWISQFREETPKLVFDILSNTRVLSLKENLNKLDIIYNGQNLKEKKENLILLTVRVSNDGNRDIREGDYYSKTIFGLKVNNGKIAEKPILIETSSKLLRDNLAVSYDTLNTIKFTKIPLNQGQYFTLKIFMICSDNNSPTISPIGNISGINNDFIIRQSYKDGQRNEKSFIEDLISGSIWIHIARFFFYILCGVAFALLIGIPTSKISSSVDNSHREKMIKKFREKSKITISEKIEFIFRLYKTEGRSSITWLHKLLQNNPVLYKRLVSIEQRKNEKSSVESNYIPGDIFYHSTPYGATYQQKILGELLDNKLFIVSEMGVTIDQQFQNELSEFSYFLDIKD